MLNYYVIPFSISLFLGSIILFGFNRTLQYYPPMVELVSVSLGVKIIVGEVLHLHFKTGQLQIIIFTLHNSLSECAKKKKGQK